MQPSKSDVTKNLRSASAVRDGAKPKGPYAMLAAIATVAVLLRYPWGHEYGVDSFVIHGLADLVVQTGSLGWLISPASYFGLAPLSYPPAVPVDLAVFASLSGLPMEGAVAVYCMLLGAAVAVNGFVLGRATFHRDSIGCVLAFLMGVTGGVLSFTNWTLSTRGTFLVLLPLALALLIRAVTSEGSTARRSWQMVIVVVFVMSLVHLLWLLLVPLMITAWLFKRAAREEDKALRRRFGSAWRRQASTWTLAALEICFLIVLYDYFPQNFPLDQFPALHGGVLPDLLVVRMAVYFATVMSVAILLVPIGLLRILGDASRTRKVTVISLALAFLPFALDPIYGALLATPVVLLVVAACFIRPFRSRNHTESQSRTISIAVAVVMGTSVLIAPALLTVGRTTAVRCGQGSSIDPQAYTAALYVRYLSSGREQTFAWDDSLNAARVEAISGVPAFEPLTGTGVLGFPWLARKAGIELAYPANLVSSLISQQQVYTVREWMPGLSKQYDYFGGKHVNILLGSTRDSPVALQLLGFYQTDYAVEICNGGNTVFFSSLNPVSYLTYSNGMESVYRI